MRNPALWLLFATLGVVALGAVTSSRYFVAQDYAGVGEGMYWWVFEGSTHVAGPFNTKDEAEKAKKTL